MDLACLSPPLSLSPPRKLPGISIYIYIFIFIYIYIRYIWYIFCLSISPSLYSLASVRQESCLVYLSVSVQPFLQSIYISLSIHLSIYIPVYLSLHLSIVLATFCQESSKVYNSVSDPHFFLRIQIQAKIFMRIRIRGGGVGIKGKNDFF